VKPVENMLGERDFHISFSLINNILFMCDEEEVLEKELYLC